MFELNDIQVALEYLKTRSDHKIKPNQTFAISSNTHHNLSEFLSQFPYKFYLTDFHVNLNMGPLGHKVKSKMAFITI